MNRRSLIGVSVGTHLVLAGVWIAGSAWQIDRLSADYKYLGSIAVSLPPAEAAAGGPIDANAPKVAPKRKITHEHVQPTHVDEKPPSTAPAVADNTGTGTGTGPGPGTDPDSTGHCLENCGPGPADPAPEPPQPPPPAGKAPQIVLPTLFAGLRVAGETQVHPSDVTKQAMIRDGRDRSVGSVKVCLDTEGNVASATMQGTTKYAEYDAQLLSSVREWRYRPYLLGTQAVPVCSVVTFVYQIK